MKSRNQGVKLYTSVIAILLVAVSTAQLSSVVLSNGTIVYAYSNSQAQSLNNECEHGACANNGPQTQADGTPIAMPVITQSGGQGEQGPPGPKGDKGDTGATGATGPEGPAPTDTATLIITKIVICIEGQVCPGLPDPSTFLIQVHTAVDPDPDPVKGSAEGTPVSLIPGAYNTGELTGATPDGLTFLDAEFSDDCSSFNGPIFAGEERECQITNIYMPE